MATVRSTADQRKLSNRLNGVMKKANDIYVMFGVKVAVYASDGGELWSYASETNWPSEMKDVRGMQKTPDDFITHSEHLRIMSDAEGDLAQLQNMTLSPQLMIEPSLTQEIHPYTAGIRLPSTHLPLMQGTNDREELPYAALPPADDQQSGAAEVPQQDQDQEPSPTAKRRKRTKAVIMTAAGQRDQRKDIYGFTGGKR